MRGNGFHIVIRIRTFTDTVNYDSINDRSPASELNPPDYIVNFHPVVVAKLFRSGIKLLYEIISRNLAEYGHS
ncbi:hypothetical protein D3C80_1924590 [compost metagenome]